MGTGRYKRRKAVAFASEMQIDIAWQGLKRPSAKRAFVNKDASKHRRESTEIRDQQHLAIVSDRFGVARCAPVLLLVVSPGTGPRDGMVGGIERVSVSLFPTHLSL